MSVQRFELIPEKFTPVLSFARETDVLPIQMADVSPDSAPPSFRSLYVCDIDSFTQEEHLWQAFALWSASIRSICIVRDPTKPRHLGHAFINFYAESDAADALSHVQPLFLNSTFCRVLPYDGKYYGKPPRVDAFGGSGVFIKNLDVNITVNMLCGYFMTFGDILSCRIATDAYGVSRMFGFITYRTPEQAQTAIAKMNGKSLGDKAITVTENRPVPDRGHRLFIRFDKHGSAEKIEDVTEEDLLAVLQTYPSFDNLSFLRNQEGRSRGYAFATMKNLEDANRAIKEVTEIRGLSAIVDFATSDHPSHRRRLVPDHEETKPTNNSNLFVRPLNPQVSEADLEALFSPYGAIISAKVMRDETGRPKGFGFLSFDNPDSAARAVAELNGTEFFDIELSVAPALSRNYTRRKGPSPSRPYAPRMPLIAPSPQAQVPSYYYVPVEYPMYGMPSDPSAILQQLGESLHPIVFAQVAGKVETANTVTGMILQQPIEHIMDWMGSPAVLESVISQAVDAYEKWRAEDKN